MKILVTGGTGLLGRYFISQYSGHDFTVLTRSITKAKKLFATEVKLIDSLARLNNLDEYDAVINLVGEPIINKRWNIKQKEKITQSRLKITRSLVDLFACSKKPPGVFLSGSAIGIYGNRYDEILTESSFVFKKNFPTALCIHWESLAKQAEPYTRVVLLRTGIVLSPQGGALKKMLLPFKCCLGGRIGDGQQFMSWIHYLDHIKAMSFLLSANTISGAVNLVSPTPEVNRVFTQKLAKSLHRFAMLPVPKKALQAILGEASCLLLDSQRVTPQVLLDNGYKFEFSNLESAFSDVIGSYKIKERVH